MMPSSSSKLPPAEKPRPAPVNRATRVSGSRSMASQTSASSRWTRASTALRLGASSTTSSTPRSGRSKRSPSKAAYGSLISRSYDGFRAAASASDQQRPYLGHAVHGLVHGGGDGDEVEVAAPGFDVRREGAGDISGPAHGHVALEPRERQLVQVLHRRADGRASVSARRSERAPHLQ